MLVEAVLFLTVVLAIVMIVIYAIPRSIPGTSSSTDLSAPVTLLSPSGWSSAPCSVRFLLHVTQAPRTLHTVDCVQPPTGDVVKFEPTCPSSDFATCKCTGSDCTMCTNSLNNSYLTKVFWLSSGVLELWMAGYTSSNDKPFVPAILKVKTAKDDTQSYIEGISLPAIPLQRWTVITIVKDGRRFDIYYGTKLVASKVLDNYPVAPGSTDGWTGGAVGWKGDIGYMSVVSKAVTTAEVAADVASVVDTQNVPFSQTNFFIDLPTFSCPGGNCMKMPTVVPATPFSVYQTTVS